MSYDGGFEEATRLDAERGISDATDALAAATQAWKVEVERLQEENKRLRGERHPVLHTIAHDESDGAFLAAEVERLRRILYAIKISTNDDAIRAMAASGEQA